LVAERVVARVNKLFRLDSGMGANRPDFQRLSSAPVSSQPAWMAEAGLNVSHGAG
jgi:hypothetical protein